MSPRTTDLLGQTSAEYVEGEVKRHDPVGCVDDLADRRVAAVLVCRIAVPPVFYVVGVGFLEAVQPKEFPMFDVLVVVWFIAVGLGLLAGLSALLSNRRRRDFLLAAGSCLAIAGLLGLASIGILFLGLSAGCFVLAGRSGRNDEEANTSVEAPASTIRDL